MQKVLLVVSITSVAIYLIAATVLYLLRSSIITALIITTIIFLECFHSFDGTGNRIAFTMQPVLCSCMQHGPLP